MKILNKKALFIIANAKGHMNPTIELAKKLKLEHNYQSIFVSSSNNKEYIEKNEFEFIKAESSPFAQGAENFEFERRKTPQAYLYGIIMRIYELVYHKRLEEYKLWIEKYNPELIILDSYFSTDFSLIYQSTNNLNTKIVLVQCIFNTYNIGSNPPLNSRLFPNQKILIYLNWKKYFLKRYIHLLILKIKFLGFDNHSQLVRKHSAIDNEQKFKLIKNKILHKSYSTIQEWILLPEKFEFKENKTHSNQQYCGLFINTQLEPIPKSIEYFLIIKQKTILVSLGTVHEIHTNNKSIFFFQKIVSIAALDIHKKYIIVTGDKYFNSFSTTYENILFMKEIPQFTILSMIDVFLTHGGPNSIMESIYQLTPMLVFPLNDVYDQNGNGARVKYHQVGLLMNLNDSEQKIKNSINKVLANYDYYQKNLTLIRQKIVRPKSIKI